MSEDRGLKLCRHLQRLTIGLAVTGSLETHIWRLRQGNGAVSVRGCGLHAGSCGKPWGSLELERLGSRALPGKMSRQWLSR